MHGLALIVVFEYARRFTGFGFVAFALLVVRVDVSNREVQDVPVLTSVVRAQAERSNVADEDRKQTNAQGYDRHEQDDQHNCLMSMVQIVELLLDSS